MNRYKVLFPFLFVSFIVCGQRIVVKNDPTHDEKPIHFGFSLGLNFMDYNIRQSDWARENNYYTGVKEIKPGINIQAVSNLRLTEYLDLRCLPGISFGERVMYFIDNNDSALYNLTSDGGFQISSSFLELPLTLKYKAHRDNNFRPFLVGGVNFRYDLAQKREYSIDQIIMIKPFDIYSEIGGGADFYLTFFKFAVELKYSVGMTNIFSETNPDGKVFNDNPVYTDMLNQLKSSIFLISFHFE
ncbi:MAG: PorT family protein [Bacteroidales bacterium]|nr:PorT family protein [Bacteroidales bacterium]MBN2817928.1 PorT family protein [Bacteroidales bacterium]